jgi:hypothetical protein
VVTLPAQKPELEVEHVLGAAISQGSLAQMQRYFKYALGQFISSAT